jgi:hypothetical protein
MEKCRYFNDHQTAVSLMIDDVLPIAVTFDGKLAPWNDWGYGGQGENSLFQYFQNNFLSRFPQVRGTFFLAERTLDSLNLKSGYHLKVRKEKDFLKVFLKDVSAYFDVAFHGVHHGKFLDTNKPSLRNNWIQEFEYLTLNDVKWLKEVLANLEFELNVKMTGGKYPGYKKNHDSEKIIESLGFKWWCSSSNMINKRCPENRHLYIGSKCNILELPTNLNGNAFNFKIFPNSLKGQVKFFKDKWDQRKTERYIHYLYSNRIPITIQEHYQNQLIDGRRVSPNLYDDDYSLNKIFSILRTSDIWYATCSELSHYLESYDYSDLVLSQEGHYSFTYNGRWDNPFLSIRSKSPFLIDLSTNKRIDGLYRNEYWIFSNLNPGFYKEP